MLTIQLEDLKDCLRWCRMTGGRSAAVFRDARDIHAKRWVVLSARWVA